MIYNCQYIDNYVDKMIKIAAIVKKIYLEDDLVRALAARDLLNITAYARSIKKRVEKELVKEVEIGSIAAAVKRYASSGEQMDLPQDKFVQKISLHTDLVGISFERSKKLVNLIGKIYGELEKKDTFLTVTQGISEITIVAESETMQKFLESVKGFEKIYDKADLIGISAKFDVKYLHIPNLIYILTRQLALQNINIIEIVSTASEISFIIDKGDMEKAVSQLNKLL